MSDTNPQSPLSARPLRPQTQTARLAPIPVHVYPKLPDAPHENKSYSSRSNLYYSLWVFDAVLAVVSIAFSFLFFTEL